MVHTSKIKNSKQSSHTDKSRAFLYNRIEILFEQYPARFLLGVLLIAALLSVLLFDIKLHIGGDDASYILWANDFVHKGILPIGFKSPGYSIVLAVFIWIVGFHIFALKLTSVIFFFGSIISFYYVFRQRLDPITFLASLLFFAINVAVLDYSHHIYSEMLYLLIQIWGFYYLWKSDESSESIRSVFIVALFGMAGFYVRAVGGTFPLAVACWYLIQRKWKKLFLFVAFSALLYLPLKLLELSHGTVVNGQASAIFMINPYNPSLGKETISGFFDRIISNVVCHLNYLFPASLSLPHWDYLIVSNGQLFPDIEAFISVLFSVFVLLGCYFAWRQGSKAISFLALYLGVYVLFLCFALQPIFQSIRYLVPVIPLIILFFFMGVQWFWHTFLKTKFTKTTGYKNGFLFVIILLLCSNFYYLKDGIDTNLPVLKANLQGNEFYGYSQDWINYFQTCKWISKQLNKESTAVICRKPEFFQIYAPGFKVYGAYNVEAIHPDTIVSHWKQWGMTHLLYDNFQWSSTLRRYIQPVAEKYPQMFEMIHQEREQYPSYVFRLNYDVYDSLVATQKGVR